MAGLATAERTAGGGELDGPDVEIPRDDLAEILVAVGGAGVEYLFDDSIARLEEDAEEECVLLESGPARTFGTGRRGRRRAQVHMDAWSRGRVTLVGDAGYRGSPACGRGTSRALVGAHVLAGELRAVAADQRLAFTQRPPKDARDAAYTAVPGAADADTAIGSLRLKGYRARPLNGARASERVPERTVPVTFAYAAFAGRPGGH
jgi:hypothetical protein